MTRQSKSIILSDFSGGWNADASPTTIPLNQALDLDNIILLPGSGFKKRNGNSVFNSSAMASGAAVHGLGYYRKADATDFMMSICGTKLYKSDSLDGTMDDITNTLTITTGQDYIWINAQMNDLSIFVGGNRATDVPIKWSGSGNGAVLGGTPPVGKFGIQGNNRFFIGNTIANPSRIYWSILGNPEDWSGTGSGSQDISTNDGDQLVGAVLLGVDHMLLFKQNSIHDLIIRASPFPVSPLFKNVGAVSMRAIVNVDGVLYFITPEPRMKATDGSKIIDFPETINSVWDGLVKSRLQYVQGVYDKTRRLILWFCTNGVGAANNYCIAWDLNRECWLKFSTGHGMNCASIMQDRTIYAGAYDGKVYQMDDPDTVDDASETTTAVTAYWRSGWMDMEQMIQLKYIPYADINFKTSVTSSSSFQFSYGYDFNIDQKEVSISMVQTGSLYDTALYDTDTYGGISDKTKLSFMKGRGKFFQYKLQNSATEQFFQINRLALPVNLDAPFALR
jgi:hypothetical protein